MIRSNQDHHALSMDEKVAAACRDAGQQAIDRCKSDVAGSGTRGESGKIAGK